MCGRHAEIFKLRINQCLYAMGAEDFLIIQPRILQFLGMTAEEEVLARHVEFFGPPTDDLYRRIDNEAGLAFLKKIIQRATQTYETQPDRRLTNWGQDLGPTALDIIGRMTSLDPAARPTIHEVLEHPWWQDESKPPSAVPSDNSSPA
jgi:serine/threonine protein kinase